VRETENERGGERERKGEGGSGGEGGRETREGGRREREGGEGEGVTWQPQNLVLRLGFRVWGLRFRAKAVGVMRKRVSRVKRESESG